MDHADHVRLLRDGVPHEPGTWADLGAGSGAFTLALADLLPPGSLIYAVDKDAALKVVSAGESPRDATLDSAELAAYAGVAALILNLDEVISRE